MQSFIIHPILGLKTNTAPNDPLLFKQGGLGLMTHAVAGKNFDVTRVRGSCSKSTGYTEWSKDAIGSAARCLGLFELKGSAATDLIACYDGKIYVYESDRDPADKSAAGVTLANTDISLYSIIQVGNYAVIADHGTTEPYVWKNGDANASKLIRASSHTDYTFRYLAPFQRRIIGAYSDQTDGDIEIRWTQDWTSSNFWTDAHADGCQFASANQLFKPGNDSITGIKNYGQNICLLYGEDSINAIDYYANYTTPFAIRVLEGSHGSVNHHSIVDAAGVHFFFNKNYGFCAYRLGSQFPYGGKPISEDIEDVISGINQNYYGHIQGVFLPQKQKIAWTVPLDGSSLPNSILFYHIIDGTWEQKDVSMRYLDNWQVTSDVVWTDLSALGYSTWADFGSIEWGQLVSSSQQLVYSNTDGEIYYDIGESKDGTSFEGVRNEPIMDFGSPNDKDLLLEVWFNFSQGGDFDIICNHRSGNTVAECNGSGFSTLGTIDCNDPNNAVLYCNKLGRYHQLSWGTLRKNEKFVVDSIEFKYVRQGRY